MVLRIDHTIGLFATVPQNVDDGLWRLVRVPPPIHERFTLLQDYCRLFRSLSLMVTSSSHLVPATHTSVGAGVNKLTAHSRQCNNVLAGALSSNTSPCVWCAHRLMDWTSR